MERFTQTGDYCPNEACSEYGKIQDGQAQQNINKSGKTANGTQRYQCKTCKRTFTQTYGTIFYRKRTAEREILETLALIAEGNRISTISRVKGHKEDTIIDWVREAGKHAEAIEEALLAEYQLTRGQIDGLWAYVGNKGEKRLPGDG